MCIHSGPSNPITESDHLSLATIEMLEHLAQTNR